MTEITDTIGGNVTVLVARKARPREDVAGRWAPAAAWTAMALMAGPYVPAWAWMWILAVAMFAACKWATWWPYRFHATPAGRHAGFLFAYAGMDGESFLLGPPAATAAVRDWVIALSRAVAGALLITLAVATLLPSTPILAGWTAMVGLVLLLHFGLLDLLAVGWRARGVNARPLMCHPARAKSVADFWGRRWNTGFRSLAHELVFEPLRRTHGVGVATAAVFLASGAVHDLVISVPARGGYGLPTLYFLVQLAALLIERTRSLRRAFARHPALGRTFTIVSLMAPLPLLFHASFVNNVIVPFLKTLGGSS